MNHVRFTPLGGVGEVGANSYLVELGGLRVLLDCGLHPKKEGFSALPDFSVLKEPPNAAIITHGHIDHCGAVPYLAKICPHTPIYSTGPTLRIMDRMLHNSVSVMGILHDEQGIDEYPLYEHADVDVALRRASSIDFHREFLLSAESPLRVEFSRAGHVLGGACVRLTTPDHTLVFTGDICLTPQELMPGYERPRVQESVDTLIIESTYGANEQADSVSYSAEIKRFAYDLRRTLENGGTVLVPSFALGRAQEMLNIIARLQDAGRVPVVPLYLSGLGRAIYDIYSRYEGLLRPECELRPLSEFEKIGDVWDIEVARRLIDKPCVIVATSGMMIMNTPSSLVAQQLVREERHGIFFVGYCDHETLGYKVKHSKKGDRVRFQLGMPETEIVLENIQSYQFSAHAPRKGLQQVVDDLQPRNLIFVHGDRPAVDWMLENSGDGATKFNPSVGETVELGA